uniref:Centrosomal protein of 97 kDa n=1 Tax=Oryzias melastigma TaxID=30732 RepID=A0A3B3BTL5_ORYME
SAACSKRFYKIICLLTLKPSGPVVDLTARGMHKLDPSFVCSEDTHTLILDRNNIMKLDSLERSPSLQQLSVANNRLVRMMGVSQLMQLRVLNLPNNSIGYIEGLRDLPHLKWLNLSGNNIKVIEQLNSCVSLQHLDLSDNSISTIGDLTKLVALKTLLLHGNSVTTLRTVPAHLPAHLSILSLAENEIRDLNEVSYLASLHELEQLSIMSNPCVMATPSLPSFDYRPYIMSWCLNLKVLDGYVVTQKEGLKAEWLYSQGKGRSFRPGQHVQLSQYLATVCPLTASPALETAENAKLEKILSKQRFHQRQLLEETRGGCLSPPRPTQLDVERHSPSHPLGGDQEEKEEPVVQFNTWVSCDPAHASLPVVHSQRLAEEHVYLEDVQTDEDKLNSSMLSSESVFLPFTSDTDLHTTHTDTEDETETFEPDSLALKRPAQPKAHRTRHSPTEKPEQTTVEKEAGATTAGVPLDGPEASIERAEIKGEVGLFLRKTSVTEADRAAVRIQSWWRGQHTRCCHPAAKEVRGEIRLRRMQDHIIFLTDKLENVQKQLEDERLQRLVQEEAVKFLWKEVGTSFFILQWQQSVEQLLAAVKPATPQIASPALCSAAPPIASKSPNPPGTGVSFPDSGFQSTIDQQSAQEDSFLSSGTADSLKTVRALSPAGAGVDSTDCSLLEQYLSSVQQREEEEVEEERSQNTETPPPSCSGSPGTAAPTTHLPTQRETKSPPASSESPESVVVGEPPSDKDQQSQNV